MNGGKPYGKSSCQDCGSILFGNVCPQGVEPKEGADSKYYVPTRPKEESVDKYAAVIKGSYYEAGYDPGDPSTRVEYDTLKYFDSREALKTFLVENNEKKYNPLTVVCVIQYQELKVKTEVVISLD